MSALAFRSTPMPLSLPLSIEVSPAVRRAAVEKLHAAVLSTPRLAAAVHFLVAPSSEPWTNPWVTHLDFLPDGRVRARTRHTNGRSKLTYLAYATVFARDVAALAVRAGLDPAERSWVSGLLRERGIAGALEHGRPLLTVERALDDSGSRHPALPSSADWSDPRESGR
jgi:hypothetical protein